MFLYDKLRDRFIGKLEETIEKKLRQQTEILQKNIESTVKEYCCPPPPCIGATNLSGRL